MEDIGFWKSWLLSLVRPTGLSAVLILAYFLLVRVLGNLIRTSADKLRMKDASARLLRQTLRAALLVVLALGLLGVWGMTPEVVWLYVSSVVGLLAIGFFAVWSILSNVVSGVFLILTHPFRVGDEIVLLPDDIRGVVTDIRLFFVVLKDAEGAEINIPSSLIFQKIVRRVSPK